MSDEDGDVGEINRKRRREETMRGFDNIEEEYKHYEKYSDKEVLNIPGPAGELLDLLKPNQMQKTQSTTPLTPTDFKEFDKKPWKEIITDLENPISIEELNKAGYLKKISKKLPLIIQTVIRYETDAYVNFIDPTGTISKEVIAMHPNILTPGSAILLHKYAVYIPSPVTRHLIVTKHNIVKFVANEQIKTPLRWNWKIAQQKVPIEIQTPTKPEKKRRKSTEVSAEDEELKRKEEFIKEREKQIQQEQEEMDAIMREEEIRERIRRKKKEEELKRIEEELNIKEEDLKRKKKLNEENSQKKQEIMKRSQETVEQIQQVTLKRSQEKQVVEQQMEMEELDEDVEGMLEEMENQVIPSAVIPVKLITDDIELNDSLEFDDD